MSAGGSAGPCRYALFGVTLESDHPFENRLAPGRGRPDLTFRVTREPPADPPAPGSHVYASPNRIDAEQSFLYIYARDDHDLMLFSEVAAFTVRPDAIVCHLLDDAYRYMVELHLLGFVMAFWLERRGLPALHAAAVAVEGRALAFLSSNKGGKSSLAASLMQLGHPLLSDDIVPVERAAAGLLAHPGYPQMRMWPDLARHFAGGPDGLELVHPRLDKRRVPVGRGGLGSFRVEACPIARLYLPERGGSAGVEIEPLPFAEALLELVRHSFLREILDGAGLQAQRFGVLAELARSAGVRRLVYPEGLERLPEVRRALLDDLPR